MENRKDYSEAIKLKSSSSSAWASNIDIGNVSLVGVFNGDGILEWEKMLKPKTKNRKRKNSHSSVGYAKCNSQNKNILFTKFQCQNKSVGKKSIRISKERKFFWNKCTV